MSGARAGTTRLGTRVVVLEHDRTVTRASITTTKRIIGQVFRNDHTQHSCGAPTLTNVRLLRQAEELRWVVLRHPVRVARREPTLLQLPHKRYEPDRG